MKRLLKKNIDLKFKVVIKLNDVYFWHGITNLFQLNIKNKSKGVTVFYF